MENDGTVFQIPKRRREAWVLVMKGTKIALCAALIIASMAPLSALAEDVGLDAAQLVEVAVEVNPQVKAARARWAAAVHSIEQNYALADPDISGIPEHR